MSKGSSESTGAQVYVAIGGSGCEALDDLPGSKVLALLAGGRRIELLGYEVVSSSVVGGLLVSYLR